jgi:pentatricopeptide repeat protein
VPILSGLLTFAVVRAELARAREIGEQLLAMAQRTADGALLANAHLRLAVVCEYEGRPRDARSHAEECLARSSESEAVPAGYGESPITAAGAYRALALWRLGYPDQALAAATDAVERARRMNHPLSLAQALILALQVRVYRREWEVARQEAAAAIDFCTEKGFPLWAIAGAVHHGGILAELGRVEEAVVQVERGIAEWRATGARVGSAVFFTMLARCYARAGRVDEGLRVVAEALEMTAETGERSEDAELHRLHGELLLQTRDAAAGGAEAALLRGLRVAREQGARAWELRTAISLGRLWQHSGRRHEALRLLADLEAQFDEGRETPDLRDATAMVAALT